MAVNAYSALERCVDRYKGFIPPSQLDQMPSLPLSEMSPNEDLHTTLTFLWEASEKDRLEWLRVNAGLQPVLMSELALAEFCHDPTAQKVREVVFPLIDAATNRVKQDAQCLKNPDLVQLKIWRVVRKVYGEVVKQKWGKEFHPNEPLPPWRGIDTVIKIREVMIEGIENGLPSVDWLVNSENRYSPENCDVVRINHALRVIQEIDQLLPPKMVWMG